MEEVKVIGPRPKKIVEILSTRGFNVHISAVKRLLRKFKETDSVARRKGSGRPLKLTTAVLAHIQFDMEQSDETTARAIHNRLSTTGADISLRSVFRGRKQLGWDYATTRYCQMIRAPNVEKRLAWATAKKAEIDAGFNFGNWIFTDESKIEMTQHKTKSCRRKGAQIKLKGRPKHPYSVLVWGGISRRGRTRLHIFTGKMDAEYYTRILDESLRPSADNLYGQEAWVLMQDNDPKHTSRLAKAYFEAHGIAWQPTPPESPDINPIELIWAELKRQLRSDFKPTTKDELIDAITMFWETLSVETCNKYIDHLYKVEASGWPEGVETESQKDAYIAKYKMQQGVELRKDKIEKNPARRTIGKFTVTNLWGFFGKRNNPAKTIYCEDYAHYCKIVMDKTKKVVDSYMVGDGDQASLVLMYEDKDEYNDGKTSKIIATFTTAFARCRLYECLDILKEQVCYMDTDSVIYLTGPGMADLPTGELMGQLTDEVAKDHGPTAFISAFASCGSKSYTLLIDDSVTGERLETVLKFKGIRPCVKNADVLTAENLTKVATDRATFSADVYGMQRDKRKATVKFNAGTKKIRFTADKRLVTKTFGSYPLGWVATDTEKEELLTTQ